MNNSNFRELGKNDIELQVERISANGISLVPYIKRETCMDELDARYGTLGWGVNYTPLPTADGLVMACSIEVYDNNSSHATTKMNYGGTNEIKRLATDAFKRACKDWGIGRELNRIGESIINAYVNVGASCGSYELEKNGSYKLVGKGQGDYEAIINISFNDKINEFECLDSFVVSELYYHTDTNKEGQIGYLKIYDVTTQQTVYVLDELTELEKEQVNVIIKQRKAETKEILNTQISEVGIDGMELHPDCGPDKIRNKTIIELTKAEANAVYKNTQDAAIKEAVSKLQKLKGWAA